MKKFLCFVLLCSFLLVVGVTVVGGVTTELGDGEHGSNPSGCFDECNAAHPGDFESFDMCMTECCGSCEY